MANIDSLLDLGEGDCVQTEEEHEPSSPGDGMHEFTSNKPGNKEPAPLLDFDPLAYSMDQDPREGEPGEIDEFDPFAAPPTKNHNDDLDSSARGDFIEPDDANNLIDTSDDPVDNGDLIEPDLIERREQQFDDLLGDFGGEQINGVAMDAEMEVNGEVNDDAPPSQSNENHEAMVSSEDNSDAGDTAEQYDRYAEPEVEEEDDTVDNKEEEGGATSDLWPDDNGEQNYRAPKQYVKQDDKRENRAPGVVIMGGGGDMSCKACQKRVYEMEKVTADKAIYHKHCFRCQHCNRVLSLGNFAAINGDLYCKPHFLEIFKMKGNYDEGFGKQRHAMQWSKAPAVVNGNSEPHQDEEDDQHEGDHVHGNETVEESGVLPSISNLKSRFETTDSRNGPDGHSNGDSDQVDYEKELPPPSFTKNRLQMFKSMEDDNQPPPSPARSISRESTPRTTHHRSRPSPDSGISDGEPHYPTSRGENGDEENETPAGDVRREDEPVDYEKELPERGFTKNLVAQWRNIETTSPSPVALTPAGQAKRSPAPRSYTERRHPTQTPVNSRGESRTPDIEREDGEYYESSSSGMNGDETDGHREPYKEEDEMPPPSFTKNMLAKFQGLQQQSQQEAKETYTPPRRQFKWQVHEAPPIRGQHELNSAQEVRERPGQREQAEYHSHDSYDEDAHHYDAEEEMPPPAFTRNMLQKFRSMEDSTCPPPTPEESAKIKKKMGSSISPGPMRRFDQSRVVQRNVYNDERPQPDGNEETQYSEEYDDERVYENSDVIKESDNFEEQERPERGTTQSLLAKFKAMQAS